VQLFRHRDEDPEVDDNALLADSSLDVTVEDLSGMGRRYEMTGTNGGRIIVIIEQSDAASSSSSGDPRRSLLGARTVVCSPAGGGLSHWSGTRSAR
jgi:hypothetical protein